MAVDNHLKINDLPYSKPVKEWLIDKVFRRSGNRDRKDAVPWHIKMNYQNTLYSCLTSNFFSMAFIMIFMVRLAFFSIS